MPKQRRIHSSKNTTHPREIKSYFSDYSIPKIEKILDSTHQRICAAVLPDLSRFMVEGLRSAMDAELSNQPGLVSATAHGGGLDTFPPVGVTINFSLRALVLKLIEQHSTAFGASDHELLNGWRNQFESAINAIDKHVAKTKPLNASK